MKTGTLSLLFAVAAGCFWLGTVANSRLVAIHVTDAEKASASARKDALKANGHMNSAHSADMLSRLTASDIRKVCAKLEVKHLELESRLALLDAPARMPYALSEEAELLLPPREKTNLPTYWPTADQPRKFLVIDHAKTKFPLKHWFPQGLYPLAD